LVLLPRYSYIASSEKAVLGERGGKCVALREFFAFRGAGYQILLLIIALCARFTKLIVR